MDNFANMTPQQKIKSLILLKVRKWGGEVPAITADTVDSLYEADDYRDARDEVRYSKIETAISGPSSRHYEAKEVAAQLPDGSWVGWTYWYGGGKHGCPEEIDWIPGAYHLTCKEEQRLVTVREFAKADSPCLA